MTDINFHLNGEAISTQPKPKQTLLQFLREEQNLTGTKPGCEIGDCGACSVIIDGELKNSCTFLMKELNGKEVITIEGISSPDGTPSDLQQAFIKNGATQCGYCTPGMVVAAEALLSSNPDPTRQDIKVALQKNLCRCTGYIQIFEAIEETAEIRHSSKGDHNA
jgi:carbon-monoxide dehydrogenase small subunit